MKKNIMTLTIDSNFLEKISNRLKNLILDEIYKGTGIHPTVAGGAIRSLLTDFTLNDVDMYFRSKQEMESVKSYLIGKSGKAIFENENTCKIKYNGLELDLCKYYKPTPEKLIKEFDYTVTMCAYQNGLFYFDSNFFGHLEKRLLIINKLRATSTIITRFQKYVKYGFNMPRAETFKLIQFIEKQNDIVDSSEFSSSDSGSDDSMDEFDSSDSYPATGTFSSSDSINDDIFKSEKPRKKKRKKNFLEFI